MFPSNYITVLWVLINQSLHQLFCSSAQKAEMLTVTQIFLFICIKYCRNCGFLLVLYNSVPIAGKATLIFRVHLGQVCSNSWVQLSWLVDLESLAKKAGVYCSSLSLLNWKECHSQHITALLHGFFPRTEQKYVLNISALSVVLHLTVLTGYIWFLMCLKSSFLSLKRPAMSLATVFSLCLSTLTGTWVTCIILDYFFFFLKKAFCTMECVQHFFAPCKTFWLT